MRPRRSKIEFTAKCVSIFLSHCRAVLSYVVPSGCVDSKHSTFFRPREHQIITV